MAHRRLEVIMAVVMITAIYITVNRVLPLAASGTSERKIVLDAGHGGSDSGKISVTGALEKDLNLSITRKLQKVLEDAGYEVILTREDENGLYSESDRNRKIADMKKRCEIINNSGADLVISIHLNSFTDSRVNGAQVFYYKHSADGKRLAACLQNSFHDNLNPDNSRVEKSNDSYYMLLNTKPPTVIAECGFLSNQQEAQLIETDDYQDKIVKAIYLAIEKYYQ